jgi:hypothetical protein
MLFVGAALVALGNAGNYHAGVNRAFGLSFVADLVVSLGVFCIITGVSA